MHRYAPRVLVEDVDQYHTGFAEWKGQLFSRLGVDKADAAGGGDDGPVKTDEQIKVETKQLRGSMKAGPWAKSG